MTNRVLCGIHALKQKNADTYFPVSVYFTLKNSYAERETGLFCDESYPSLDHTLDALDTLLLEFKDKTVAGLEYTEEELLSDDVRLDKLIVYYPDRKEIGEHVQGTIVGWHVDLKINANKKKSPAVLLSNIAWMNNKNEVHYVVTDKMDLPPMSEEDIVATIDEAFKEMCNHYKLGGNIGLDVVPVGKHRARYCLAEYTAPKTFMEKVCHALRTNIH